MLKGRKVLVVGGGIGGLAAALALHQRGASPRVLEQAPAITEVGAGLQISPNGVCVLRALGLDAALRKASVKAEAVVLRDFRRIGEVLRLDLRRMEGQDYFFVHRADLIDLLESAVRSAGIDIQLNSQVREVMPGAQPSVILGDGQQLSADLVVGADGLHSKARLALVGESRPFFTGQVAFRAVVPASKAVPPEARLVMAPGRHVVSYPIRGGQMVNLAAFVEQRDWVEEGWHHSGDPEAFRALYSDFTDPVREVIDAVDQVATWGLFRHEVAPVWYRDHVALLGDAAHPTLPFMAQGANLALEDAWVLAASLDGEGGLARYQSLRRPRAQKVISAANRNAWKYHVRFGPARWLGHLGLSLAGTLAPEVMLRQFDWIYGHDVTRG